MLFIFVFRSQSIPKYIRLNKFNKVLVVFLVFIIGKLNSGDRGGTVVKVLCYKSEGRWFDSRWCYWYFSLTYSSLSHYGPGVDSASNRNEYQENFLGLNAAGA